MKTYWVVEIDKEFDTEAGAEAVAAKLRVLGFEAEVRHATEFDDDEPSMNGDLEGADFEDFTDDI